MTETEVIATINELMDEYARTGEKWTSTSIARRAIERLGEGVVAEGSVVNLVNQVYAARYDTPLPGTTIGLREVEGVARVARKPSLMEMLHAGQEEDEPLEATVARMRKMHPGVTRPAVVKVIEEYQAWLLKRAEKHASLARGLDRVGAICKPVWDEDSSLTIEDALKIMASRGDEAAQRELASWG
jgi:hypothetical protein